MRVVHALKRCCVTSNIVVYDIIKKCVHTVRRIRITINDAKSRVFRPEFGSPGPGFFNFIKTQRIFFETMFFITTQIKLKCP